MIAAVAQVRSSRMLGRREGWRRSNSHARVIAGFFERILADVVSRRA